MIFKELKDEMIKQNVSQGKIAEKIGISRVSFNYKMNGRTQFTLDELVKIKEILNITDYDKYFFNKEV